MVKQMNPVEIKYYGDLVLHLDFGAGGYPRYQAEPLCCEMQVGFRPHHLSHFDGALQFSIWEG